MNKLLLDFTLLLIISVSNLTIMLYNKIKDIKKYLNACVCKYVLGKEMIR